MASKSLTIIVDDSLFDAVSPALAEAGHVVKKLSPIGYNLILGPKVCCLTTDDLAKNPKLLQVALKHATTIAYPKKETVIDVEDTQAPAGKQAKKSDKATSRKRAKAGGRKPRAQAAESESGGQSAVNQIPNTTGGIHGGDGEVRGVTGEPHGCTEG